MNDTAGVVDTSGAPTLYLFADFFKNRNSNSWSPGNNNDSWKKPIVKNPVTLPLNAYHPPHALSA
jgi:hypothetical protein